MGYITYAERKWKKEGIKEGIREGKREGLQKAIESVLEVKFGSVEAEILSALSQIKSLEKLESLLHQSKLVKSADDFKNLLSGDK